MTVKKKIYAVKTGRTTGIFLTWGECRKQVIGYPGAAFKGFPTREEAESYLSGGTGDDKEKETVDKDTMTAYVDGSYDPSQPGRFSCGVVYLYRGQEETYSLCVIDGELARMRNVAGEVRGAMEAMKYCVEHGIPGLQLYYDYAGIEKWCTGEWKCNLRGTKMLKEYYDSIRSTLKVSFHKVKSHTGVKYNEEADRLAKKALQRRKRV